MTPEAERVLCQAFDDMRARLAQATDELHFNHGEAERWRKRGEELAQELGRAVAGNSALAAERCAAAQRVLELEQWRAWPSTPGMYAVDYGPQFGIVATLLLAGHLAQRDVLLARLLHKPRAFLGPLPLPPEEIGNRSERRDDNADRNRTDAGTDARTGADADRARAGTDARAEPDPAGLLDPERGRSRLDDGAARRVDDPVAT